MITIWKFLVDLARGSLVGDEPHKEVEPQEQSPEEKGREEAEFDQYCEEQRELNAIDAQICAKHG
jgi:hypothetical protein